MILLSTLQYTEYLHCACSSQLFQTWMIHKSIIWRTPVSLDAKLLNEYIRPNFAWIIYNYKKYSFYRAPFIIWKLLYRIYKNSYRYDYVETRLVKEKLETDLLFWSRVKVYLIPSLVSFTSIVSFWCMYADKEKLYIYL